VAEEKGLLLCVLVSLDEPPLGVLFEAGEVAVQSAAGLEALPTHVAVAFDLLALGLLNPASK